MVESARQLPHDALGQDQAGSQPADVSQYEQTVTRTPNEKSRWTPYSQRITLEEHAQVGLALDDAQLCRVQCAKLGAASVE
jgi:hypothetical protein